MIDMFGNKLDIGDIVVYNWKYSRYSSKYVKCKIISFTNQKVYIKFITNDDADIEMLVNQDKIIKAPVPKKKRTLTDKIKYAIEQSINSFGKRLGDLP